MIDIYYCMSNPKRENIAQPRFKDIAYVAVRNAAIQYAWLGSSYR